MAIYYSSTRNAKEHLTASQAILKGLADDGGLFVPNEIPALDVSLKDLAGMSYQQTAFEVMKLFLTDFTEEELKACIGRAYDSKFDTEEIAPLVEAKGAYYLELFHGATIAFKDMALSILPHLLTTAALGFRGRGGDKDHRLLSEGRCQSDPGAADGDPTGRKYLRGGHSGQL